MVHVPPHGAPVDAEPVGQLGHRPDAAGLEAARAVGFFTPVTQAAIHKFAR